MGEVLRRLSLLVLIVSVMVAACRAGDGVPPTGRVNVGIVYIGGPDSGASNVLRHGTIRVTDLDGTFISRVRVKQGHFDPETLDPGTYRFSARSGDAQCRTRIVAVKVGSNPSILIPCSVK